MLTHQESFRLEARIQLLTLHAITFDVIFESAGNATPWHTDYESLGPFVVPDALCAIRQDDFVSIHFNLTEDGGSLVTLPWSFLSYIHCQTIIVFGIFSTMHKVVTFLTIPFFAVFSHIHTNRPLVGNAFNNLKLHSVTSGRSRTSYVVRLVKKDSVKISQDSILLGMQRSQGSISSHPSVGLGRTSVRERCRLEHGSKASQGIVPTRKSCSQNKLSPQHTCPISFGRTKASLMPPNECVY